MSPRARHFRFKRRARAVRCALVALCAALAGAVVTATFDVLGCHDNGVVGTIVGAGVEGMRDGRFEKSFLRAPAGAACNATVCYVTESGNNAVKTINIAKSEMVMYAGSTAGTAGSTDGKAKACAEKGETQALFKQPASVVLVSQSSSYYAAGDVLVVDSGNNAIRRVSGDDVSTLITGLAFAPTAMVFDESDGAIYFLGSSQNHVSKIAYGSGTVSTYAGSQGTSGLVDNVTPSSARFNAPEGLALDGANRILYVADTGNHAVRAIDLSTGAVTTVLGDGTISASGAVLDSDGILSTPARFNYPAGIAYNLDSSLSSGVLLVTDRGTHQIRKIILTDATASNAATVVTVAGSYTGTSGFRDSTVGSAALLNKPVSISYVSGSTYVVVDQDNHAIRKVSLEAPVQITFTMQSVADIEKTEQSHDLVIEEYGSYSVNGPPYNETTHFSGVLTYFGEIHELVMCAYPSVEYFVKFEGAMQATVKDASYLYFGYTGATVDNSLARTFRIRGPGCTDASAPNYNPFATSDDGSCVSGVQLRFTVGAYGVIDHAVYEFEGPGFYISDSFESGSGEAHYEQSIDFDFMAYPGAVYIATFYGALNASLTTVSGQSGLGATLITYWTYTSSQASDQSVQRARVIGPGCIDPSYPSYDQYALASDEVNACTFASTMRVVLNASASAESWYDFGSIVGTSDQVASVDGISLDNATDQFVLDMSVTPGVYEFESYGDVSGAIQQYDSGSYTNLRTWLGTDSSLRTDSYGFSTTTDSERITVSFPFTFSLNIGANGVVGYAGGVLVGDDGTSSVTFVEGSVPALATITSTFTQVASSTSIKNSLWYTSNTNILGVSTYVMALTPTGYQLAVSAALSLKYDKTGVPSQEGNENIVLFKASDSTMQDAITLYGATFDAANGIASATIDSMGTYGVAFRATVRSISPPRGWLDGDVTVTLDGVDFSSLSTVNTVTTYQKCRWGETFTVATTVASSDTRSQLSGSDSTILGTKINAVSCQSPVVAYAGFTIVEFHDSRNGMSSDTRFVYLQTASPQVRAVVPPEGVSSGGTVVSLSGSFLRAGAVASDWEKYDLDTTFFANSGPNTVSCVFGSTTSSGIAVSSAFARCESPPSTTTASKTLRVGDLSHQVAGYGVYTYVTDFDAGITTSAYEDHSGDSSFTDGGVVVDLYAATGSLTKQRNSFYDWRCLFGTVSVAARRKPYGDLSCVSTSIARGTTVDVRLVGPLGEHSLLLGNITAATIASTYVDSIVTLPGTPKIVETITIIERAISPPVWEPLKWVSTAHALVATPGGSWSGTSQGYGHGTYGVANCTFTTDAGVVTTRVANIISSALVVCEAPITAAEEWYSLTITSNGVSSGSPRTSLKAWYEPVTRSGSYSLGDVVDAWLPSATAGGVVIRPYFLPSSASSVSTLCYFGVSIDPVAYSSSVCTVPRSLSPGFVAITLGVASVGPSFAHQIEILEPVHASMVLPRFVDANGGSIVDIMGRDLYSGPGAMPIYCGYTDSSTIIEAVFVSSGLLKCETALSSNTIYRDQKDLEIGRYDDFTGTEPIELSLSPGNGTIALEANVFGLQTLLTPTVTAVSPVASSAQGGAIFAVTGTQFASQTGYANCVFGNVFVAAMVYNSTYADCVVPSLYPMRTYDVSFAVTGSAGQRELDVGFAYANGTALAFSAY